MHACLILSVLLQEHMPLGKSGSDAANTDRALCSNEVVPVVGVPNPMDDDGEDKKDFHDSATVAAAELREARRESAHISG